ncbi:hypothetical protein PR202_ga17230 [Eleusine coracana subsp. coracana]|uniref:Autophagy-related protein 2 n=1 Tax=Eleusine coracana subsp. coracana TaxID=191504 RepID=A0AAV5CQ06_ELECO|nr:hypothetical protein PR202_ga17230 [Eleusine coracana subsp. coracana]
MNFNVHHHHTLYSEEYQCISGGAARDDGGWYNNSTLTIVENHVLKENNEQGEKSPQRDTKPTFSSKNPDESCNLKGKVLIHEIDVKWRMYAGDDWLIPQKDLDLYPDGDVSVSKLSISAQDLNLCDQSANAPWKSLMLFNYILVSFKKVLGCYTSKDYPRESCSCAFRLELESVRPEPQAPLEDYRFSLEILPLQLHLDQGQLNFLISFFQNDPSNNESHLHSDNDIGDVESTSYGSNMIVEEALLPFFQVFMFISTVLFIHSGFETRYGKGNYAELLNILPWKGIDLKLKHVSAMGVYGWNSICETVAAEWLEDISKNQVLVLPCLPLPLDMYAFIHVHLLTSTLRCCVTIENSSLHTVPSEMAASTVAFTPRSTTSLARMRGHPTVASRSRNVARREVKAVGSQEAG